MKTFKEFINDQPDLLLDEETGDHYYNELSEDLLVERKIVVKVTSKGAKWKKILCGPGRVLKTVNGRKVCVVQTGSAKAKKRLAIRKAVRTKKAKGLGYQRRITFKRNRAIKRRKSMGLRDKQTG